MPIRTGGKLKVPVLSYEQIRERADAFLAQYNPSGRIPVPIEEITEFSLNINIVPIPGLQRLLNIDGFISSDFSSISVDQFVMEERVKRYRFTLAHEIGHAWLHGEVFSKLHFSSIDEWKSLQTSINDEDYGWLEYQGYSFGGLVLVPKEALAKRAEAFERIIAGGGLNPKTEAAQLIVMEKLAAEFEVSTSVIEKRLDKDR